VVDLEDELKTIGENMKILEVEEEKALAREEKFQVQLSHISLAGGIFFSPADWLFWVFLSASFFLDSIKLFVFVVNKQ
jgi:hypothetical protein